jgi:hypothetical protein
MRGFAGNLYRLHFIGVKLTALPQECSFYEVEVPGKGVQTECRPTEHADHATEVAMMSVAGSVGFIACLLRVFFST